MNTKKIIINLLIIIVVSLLSYWAGSRSPHITRDTQKEVLPSGDNSFDRGLKVGAGRQAWFQAAESRLYLMLVDANDDNKYERIRNTAIDDMWLALINLDDFVRNEDATTEDREAASRVLAAVVNHFKKHPKTIEMPEGTKLREEYNKRVASEINEGDMNDQEKKVFSEINDKLPLSELEGLFDGVLTEFHKRDLATQVVLDRLIKERHLPGRKRQCAGITFWTPKVKSSSSTSSGSDFSFSGAGIEVSYREGLLTMNGDAYGKLSKGDVVDFRDEGLVFVNGVKRLPMEKNKPNKSQHPTTSS